MDFKLRAQELLDEWQVVKNAKPKHNAVNLQLEKDWLEKWSHLLQTKLLWADDPNDLAETVYQFERRLNSHKDKVVLEILQHGPI